MLLNALFKCVNYVCEVSIMAITPVNSTVQPQKKTFKEKAITTGANLTGLGIGLAVPYTTLRDTFSKTTIGDAKNTAEFMSKFMPDVDTFENTAKNINKIIKDTGLDAKGVKFHSIDGNSAESLRELKNIISSNIKKPNKINNRLAENYVNIFGQGANAAYFSGSKDIVVNRANLYTSAYHEVGHAMNANGGFFGRALQKARNITPMGISLVAPVVLAVGLLHKVDKTKPQEEKGKVEKTLDFVSNHAGKLTLASYVPLLAEEGLASYKGLREAKKFLSPDKLKKLTANYAKAWGTYAITAALVAGGVALGIAVANGIKNKFAAKQAEKQASQVA